MMRKKVSYDQVINFFSMCFGYSYTMCFLRLTQTTRAQETQFEPEAQSRGGTLNNDQGCLKKS